MVGDAERRGDRQALEERAQRANVGPFLEITGFLPRAEALARIARAAVCISPFFPTPVLQSTSPTKLIEYLALAIPVVANDHPEQRRVLKECRAGLCVPWGARYFARAVRSLMALSPEQRAALGKCGREWVQTHRAYDRIATAVESAYQHVLFAPE